MKLSIKKELTGYDKKREKKIANIKWILRITLLAFSISLLFSFLSESIIPKVNIIVGIVILVLFIILGILFDMIGVAVTASDIVPFNSMSARKVYGAKVAVNLKKNAEKVSSFCNDVIGDVCGIISGSTGAIVAVSLSNILKIDATILTLITMSIIAALTIGGKAAGKSIAINQSNIILYKFAKFIAFFCKNK